MKYAIGYVYAAVSTGGLVKVGRSRSAPEKRIRSHSAMFRVFGEDLAWSKTSGRLSHCYEAERKLIDFCRIKCAESSGNEFFKGIDLEDFSRFFDANFKGDSEQAMREAEEFSAKQAENLKSIISHGFCASHGGTIKDDGEASAMLEAGLDHHQEEHRNLFSRLSSLNCRGAYMDYARRYGCPYLSFRFDDAVISVWPDGGRKFSTIEEYIQQFNAGEEEFAKEAGLNDHEKTPWDYFLIDMRNSDSADRVSGLIPLLGGGS